MGGFTPTSATGVSPAMTTSPAPASRYGTTGSSGGSNGGTGYSGGMGYNGGTSPAAGGYPGSTTGVQQTGAYSADPGAAPAAPPMTSRKSDMNNLDFNASRPTSDLGGRTDPSAGRTSMNDGFGGGSTTVPTAAPQVPSATGNASGRSTSPTDVPPVSTRSASGTGNSPTSGVQDVLPPAPQLSGSMRSTVPAPDAVGSAGDALSNPPPPLPQTSMNGGPTKVSAGPDIGNSLIPPSK
jgi:hypothetical protein